MPASLGPGLRTVSGAKFSIMMALTELADNKDLPHVPRRWRQRPLAPPSSARSDTRALSAEEGRGTGGSYRRKAGKSSRLRSDVIRAALSQKKALLRIGFERGELAPAAFKKRQLAPQSAI
jgi:hypothetical protein